jgi:hypothetical protein
VQITPSVFDVRLQRAVVLELLGAFGVRRQDIHDRVAAAREGMGEGEAVMPGEFEANEHPRPLHVRKQGLELRVRALEAVGLAPLADIGRVLIRALRHHRVFRTSSVDALPSSP